MTKETILQLPTTVALDGSEQIEIVQNGTSKQSTTGAVAGLANLYPTTTGGYVLGNNTANPAVAAFHSLSSTMDIPLGTVQGSIPYRGAANWGGLTPGVYGQVLRTGGPNADPFWATVPGTGTVVQINPGTNISMSPDPITVSGTISTVANPVFATSTTTPIVYGGTTASSILTLQSTSGVGTTDSIAFKTGNNGAVTALSLSTTGAAAFVGTVSGTNFTGTSYNATKSVAATATTGAFFAGTLSYSDTNVLESLQTSANSYAQFVIQNTNSGASASTDVTISNDAGTSSTNYANFGINSSGFAGTGSLSQPNNVYLTSASSDLVIGTLGSNAIRFVVNSGTTDAMSISSTGVVTIPSAEIVQSSLQVPLITGGSTASSTLTLQSTSGAGTTDAIYLKTGNNGAVTALSLSTTGAATFANSVAATTVSASTSVTTPTVYGGSSVSQALTFQSTTGVGTTDSILFKTGNNGAVTALSLASSGAAAFVSTVSGTNFTGTSYNATKSVAASATTGAFFAGTLGYSDTNVLESLQTSANSYAQLVIQNTNNGATASADITISNDLGTASTYYANFGINSSGFTGTGSLNQPNNVYITSASSDIVLATLGSNSIRFVVNSGATDAMTISAAGVVTIPNAEIVQTSLQTPLVTGGTTASSSLTLQSTSGVGTTDSIIFKVGNNGATTALTIGTGTAGSLTFGGTAQRFIADFDNATVLSRFSFVTKTLNASTGIYALPNGSSTAASWQATNAADPTNASKVLIATNGSTDVQLVSGVNGAGSYLPLALYNGGSSRMTVSPAGNVNVASGTYENSNTIAAYTIPNGSNAVSSGPISITGTFVISTGSSWTCV